MDTLKLTLKKKWFDFILSGNKKEEYRELKPYWLKRLFYNDCNDNYDTDYMFEVVDELKKFGMSLKELEKWSGWKLKPFNKITFYNGGYFSDKLPNFTVELNDVVVGFGEEMLGAENGKRYFVLKLGNIINKNL